MIKRHANLDMLLLMVEETSQPTVPLDMTFKHALEYSRSISLVYTANSQEGGSWNFIPCQFELKMGGGAFCVI
jgi:cytochrome c oxidase assembly protein Cox11